jgi:hypothetical protein
MEKAQQMRHVRNGKANESESPMKCRKRRDDIKTRGESLTWDKSIGDLFTGWMVSGMKVARVCFWLLCGTAGTCRSDAKGEIQGADPRG